MWMALFKYIYLKEQTFAKEEIKRKREGEREREREREEERGGERGGREGGERERTIGRTRVVCRHAKTTHCRHDRRPLTSSVTFERHNAWSASWTA